jgi:hypothetical protein
MNHRAMTTAIPNEIAIVNRWEPMSVCHLSTKHCLPHKKLDENTGKWRIQLIGLVLAIQLGV